LGAASKYRGVRDAAARRLGFALLTAATAVGALPAAAAAQSGRLDLPVVAIDAPEGIVDEPKRTGTMRVFDRRYREVDSGRIGIEVRGQSSQNHPKKSYSIETRSRSGENRNVSLLGMPKDDDWVLIGNYEDLSLLRNFIVYSTARWLGRYAPRTRLVEVGVNGSYEGVYLLAEQLKVHESRVAVDDSDISGGYLLEMTSKSRTEGEQFFTTPVEEQPVIYADPNRDDLSHRRAAWIRRYVNRFERRLYGKRFRHRRRGYRRQLNVGAAVDYLLLNELFRNTDTFTYSTYMHKSVGEKLVLGPLWDFDQAIGRYYPEPDFNRREGWQYTTRFRQEKPGRGSPWAGRLYADPAFRRRMARRWRSLRRQRLKSHIMRTIDRGTRQLEGGPRERNASRWPPSKIPDDKRVADPRTGAPPADHAQAVDYLKWWLRGRISWIDGNIDSLRP